jgi:hypothetical protein
MEHRTQLEIDGLQRAEGVLNAADTTSRPLAFNSSRLPARTKFEIAVSIGGSSDKRPAAALFSKGLPRMSIQPPTCPPADQPESVLAVRPEFVRSLQGELTIGDDREQAGSASRHRLTWR